MSSVLEKIRSRGHWRFLSRPADFEAKRIADYPQLFALVQRSSVKLAGWEVPPVEPPKQNIQTKDSVGQKVDWSQYVEYWRLHQSGQFVHYAGIFTDWWDQSDWAQTTEDWKPGLSLRVPEVLFRLTGFIEFCARLSLTEAGAEQMHLEVELLGLQGRTLEEDSSRFSGFSYPRTTSLTDYPWEFDFSREKLIADPQTLALDAALELFQRFDWNPPVDLLREHQKAACGF